MSNDQPPPPGPGGPDDDPFRKRPQNPAGGDGTGQGWGDGGRPGPPPPGSPYGGGAPPPPGSPYGGGGGMPPYDPNAYGGPYGGGPDPLAGMPPLADFGKRLAARIIDTLIVFVPLFLLSLIFGGWGVNADGGDSWDDIANEVNTGRQWVWSAISLVAYIGYDTWMVKKNGQTVGKRLLKLRVAMLNDGSTPDTRSSLIRAAVLWAPALICCFCLWWLVLIVTILTDKPYKQGLHDKAGRTVVVTVPQ
ncbi:RDD family protein [Streptomyces sp. CAU 1734]|uniref:RDD family protein n=1 Tax=Streptomyces sp. CAU 1734 TaxID=3140360 RepID=UPI00325FF4AF